MRTTLLFTTLLVLSLALSPPGRSEEPLDPRDTRLSEAILALMDADEQVEAGATDAAVANYTRALGMIQRLRQEHPDFKPEIVGFRAEYLEERLQALRPAPRETRETTPPPREDYERLYLQAKEEAVRASTRLLEIERRSIDLQLTLRERDQALRELREQSEAARREADRSRNELDRELREARSEVQSLRRFNTLLESRVATLEEERENRIAELAQVREESAKLNLDLQTARGEIAAARAALEDKTRQAGEDVEHLGTRLLRRTEQLRETQSELDTLREQVEADKERLADVSVLEDTVIELNRRLNLQEERLAEKEGLRDEVARLREALAGTGEERDALLDRVEPLQTRAAQLEEERDAARQALRESKEGTAVLESKLETAMARAADAEEEKATLALKVRNMSETLEQQQSHLEEQLAHTTRQLNEITRLRRELASRNETVASLEAEIKRFETTLPAPGSGEENEENAGGEAEQDAGEPGE